MTSRAPLVLAADGLPEQLQSGDTLKGDTATIVFQIDGGGAAIAANQAVYLPDMPAAFTITGWTIVADASTTCVIDILRTVYANFPGSLASIAGTDKPSLTAAQKATDTTLTGWGSTAIAAGDVLQAKVSSNNNATLITVVLRGTWA